MSRGSQWRITYTLFTLAHPPQARKSFSKSKHSNPSVNQVVISDGREERDPASAIGHPKKLSGHTLFAISIGLPTTPAGTVSNTDSGGGFDTHCCPYSSWIVSSGACQRVEGTTDPLISWGHSLPGCFRYLPDSWRSHPGCRHQNQSLERVEATDRPMSGKHVRDSI